jgi:hypothetical protein
MKNAIKILAVLAIAGFAGNASAQSSASATGNASGAIIAPISITPSNSQLAFGNIVTGTSGTVTEQNGADNYSPAGLSPGAHGYGNVADAQYEVNGQPNEHYAWSLSAPNNNNLPSGVTLVSIGLDDNVGTWTSADVTGGNGATSGTGQLSNNSNASSFLAISGKLAVSGAEAAGPFSGNANFTLTVMYN